MADAVRLLIVEDQCITLLGLRVALGQYEQIKIVGEAEDGLEALQLVETLRPDVILLDVGLPKLNGIEVCRRVKSSNPEIKIIMFTSHDSPDEAFAALSSRAEGYCLKNTSAEQLVRAILSVHAGAVWLDANLGSRLLSQVKLDNVDNCKNDLENSKKKQYGLTDREVEVLSMLVNGLSNKEISDRLFVSSDTTKTHIRHLMQKLAVSDRTQAAVKALKESLLE